MLNLRHTLEKYHDYITLNRTLVISIASAMLVSAIFAQVTKGDSHVNATSTIAVSYAVYYLVFGVLYYASNRKRYVTKSGIDKQKLRQDLFKIMASVGAAEIVYFTTRWVLHYYLLEVGQEPFAASILAHVVSASIFVLITNIGVSLTKLYKETCKSSHN